MLFESVSEDRDVCREGLDRLGNRHNDSKCGQVDYYCGHYGMPRVF